MKLLLDQGLPRSATTLRSEVGIDTVHVAEIGLSAADDTDIIQRARDDERVVVTLDADFHALLALSAATSPSVRANNRLSYFFELICIQLTQNPLRCKGRCKGKLHLRLKSFHRLTDRKKYPNPIHKWRFAHSFRAIGCRRITVIF
ncbi:MAG: DUF5615 family PIN-like protein [Xenococcaceae cyanobacterium MO_188.B32]|nr:DUF5615 family PIN-like protein [Xenococcaceae cyanobacterium MO_188.B32]